MTFMMKNLNMDGLQIFLQKINLTDEKSQL